MSVSFSLAPLHSLRMDPSYHTKPHYSAYKGLSPLQSIATDFPIEPRPLFSQHQHSLVSHFAPVEHSPSMLSNQTRAAYIPVGIFPTRDTWDQVLAVHQ